MPVLVNCPSCHGPLRVADDLLGRKVRCPACQTVFNAASESNGDEELPPTQRIDSWKHLDLELNRDPAPPSSSPPPPPPPPSTPAPPLRGLVGAVEVDAGPEESPRRPPPPRDDPRPSRRADDEEDTRPCPVCERRVHRDSTRCYNCGERFTASEPRRESRRDRGRDGDNDYRRGPRDRDFLREGPRRDTEPHRGGVVLTLGVVSLVCLLGFCVYGIPNVLGAVLGMIGWWLGHVDLKKMKAGSMDPEGHGTTMAGYVCSIIGALLNLAWVLTCGVIVLFIMNDAVNQRKMQQRPGFQQQQQPFGPPGQPPPPPPPGMKGNQ